MPGMRLDKILTHLNCGSRREVAAWVRAGRVTVDGQTVRDPAYKADPDLAALTLDGRALCYRAQRYYMLNKPAGVITANRDGRHQTVMELFPENERKGLFAIGRLDKDTEGLLLITDDGALSHALMAPGRHVQKLYEAVCDGELAPDAEARFHEGLTLGDGTVCRPAALEIVRDAPALTVRVTLCEGKYHQVKRMLKAVGAEVTALKRLSIGALGLDTSLAPGAYRPLTEAEIALLRPSEGLVAATSTKK